MSIKLANNASAHLAAPLAIDGTTIVLVEAEASTFPALGVGEWFPLTLADAMNNIEIVKVTAVAANILTAVRAQEGTSARAFIAGARAEIRLTAAVISTLQSDTTAARTYTDTVTDDLADTLRTESATDIAALEAQTATNLAVALGALVPVGFGPIPWSRTAAPSGWIFADGRTLFSNSGLNALRSVYIADGFPFGQDGSGNPKIPDMRGRVPAGLDNMGSGAASRLTGATLGAALGAQTHTLTTAEMPTHNHGVNDPTHVHGVSDPTHTHGASQDAHTHTFSPEATAVTGGYGLTVTGGFANRVLLQPGGTTQGTDTTAAASANGVYVSGAYTGVAVVAAATGITTQNSGSGTAHNNVQLTLVTHFIVKS